MSDLIVKDEKGNPRFIGTEDPNNPPVRQPQACNHGSDTCSHLQCPKCGEYFDYLLGDIQKGCESCYDSSKDTLDKSADVYDKSKEIA